MGHIIDQYGYNQIYRDVEYVKDEYRKVLKFLNYLSHSLDLTDSTTDELMNRIADLEAQLDASIQATSAEKNFQEGFMEILESPTVRDKFMTFLKDLAEEE